MGDAVMTFQVAKLASGKWAVSRVYPGWITPIGSYGSRKAAKTVASVLAGRTGKVVMA